MVRPLTVFVYSAAINWCVRDCWCDRGPRGVRLGGPGRPSQGGRPQGRSQSDPSRIETRESGQSADTHHDAPHRPFSYGHARSDPRLHHETRKPQSAPAQTNHHVRQTSRRLAEPKKPHAQRLNAQPSQHEPAPTRSIRHAPTNPHPHVPTSSRHQHAQKPQTRARRLQSRARLETRHCEPHSLHHDRRHPCHGRRPTH